MEGTLGYIVFFKNGNVAIWPDFAVIDAETMCIHTDDCYEMLYDISKIMYGQVVVFKDDKIQND